MAAHASDDVACGFSCRRLSVEETRRVQEGVEQQHAVLHTFPVRALERFVEHRVTEAVDRVGELGHDTWVEVGLVARATFTEQVDRWLYLASKLFEYEVLVFHLGDKLRGLEHSLGVAEAARRVEGLPLTPLGTGKCAIGLDHRLDLFGEAVVLAVEHVVHGREADVLVGSAVTCDVVSVQHLVVVCRTDVVVLVRAAVGSRAGKGVSVGCARWGCMVCDVVEERTAGALRAGRCGGGAIKNWKRALRQHRSVLAHHELREPVGARDEVSVGVGHNQRDGTHIRVDEFDSEDVACLRLECCPVGHAIAGALNETTGRDGHAADELVLTQEHLVRRMRGIGLALVHERRRLVDRIALGGLRRPGEEHDVRSSTGRWVVERVIRIQVDHHGACGRALARQVEAVVEELTEQREPRVVRGRDATVRRGIADEEGALFVNRRCSGVHGDR